MSIKLVMDTIIFFPHDGNDRVSDWIGIDSLTGNLHIHLRLEFSLENVNCGALPAVTKLMM